MDTNLMEQIKSALPADSHVTLDEAYDCLHWLTRKCATEQEDYSITGLADDSDLPIPHHALAGFLIKDLCVVINTAVNNVSSSQQEKVFLFEAYGCDCSLVIPEIARG